MKKSLLAAAFAAAFIASGGVATAADDTLVLQADSGANDWNITVDGTGAGTNQTIQGDVTAGSKIDVPGTGLGDVLLSDNNLNITANTSGHTGTLGGSIITGGKTVTIGVNAGDTIGLTVLGGVTVENSATDILNVADGSSLTTTTASSIAAAGTMNVAGTLTNGALMTNSGTLTFAVTSTYGGGPIDNSATAGTTKGIVADLGMTGGLATLATAIGNAGGTGGNVGYVTLTGTGKSGGAVTAFTNATGGDVVLDSTTKAVTLAQDTINAEGANLTVTGTANQYTDTADTVLIGANVTFKDLDATGDAINATVTAGLLGSTTGNGNVNILQGGLTFSGAMTADVGGGGDNDGKIIVKAADGDIAGQETTFSHAVNGQLDLATTAVFDDDTDNVFNNNLTFSADTTLVNLNTNYGNIDLSGKITAGKGTIDNSAADADLILYSDDTHLGGTANTTFSADVTIKNAGIADTVTGETSSGYIHTDNAMLNQTYKQYDVSTVASDPDTDPWDGGFGWVTVIDNLNGTIDWSTAGGGILEMRDQGVASSITGTYNLGRGELWTNDDGTTVQAGSTITAKAFVAWGDDTNNGTINADVEIIDGREMTNGTTGIINLTGDTNVGGGMVNETLIFHDADSKLINQGTVNMSKVTVIDGAVTANALDNKDGKLNASGEMLNDDWDDLMTILDPTTSVGEVNISGNLKDGTGATNDLALGAAADGVVTLSGTLDTDAVINVGGADLNITGANNKVTGTVAGDDITISGKDGVYSQTVTAAKTLDITADNAFLDGWKTTNGATVRSGVTASVAGNITGNSTVQNGGTLDIIGDTKIDNGTLDAQAGSTLNFFGTPTQLYTLDTVNGGILNVVTTGNNPTTIQVDEALAKQYDYVDAVLVTKEAVATTGISNDQWTAYLNTLGYNSVNKAYVYSLDANGNVVYNGVDSQRSETQWNNTMNDLGLGNSQGSIGPNTTEQIYNYADMTQAEFDALTQPAREVAGIFNGLGGGDINNLRGKTREALATLQYATGNDLAGTFEAVTDTMRAFNRAIMKRGVKHTMYDECGQPIDPNCYDCKPTNRIWAGYTGLFGDQDARSWDGGYKYDAHGLNVGYDLFACSGITFGAAYGYSKGDYENKMALWDDSDIENHSFGLYGSYTHDSGFYAAASGSYTRSSYDIRSRYLDAATSATLGMAGWDRSNYKSNGWTVGGEVGYDLKLLDNLVFTPSIGVYHYSITSKNFNTDNGTRLGMKYTRTQTEMPVEASLRYDIATGEGSALSLVANGGYSYNFTNKGAKIKQFTFADGNLGGNTYAVKPGSSGWNVGGGISFKYRSFDVGAHYEYYGRKEYSSHNVTANVGVSF